MQKILRKTYTKGRLLTLIIITLAATLLKAQPFCNVRTFSISQGLTTNTITHLTQDDKGLMWLSSINGLWSFDGYEFTPYRDLGELRGMTSQRYISVRVTSCGTIYLTDNDRRLFLYDCQTNRFTNLMPILRDKGISMQVHDIMPLPNGHTWLIGTRETSPGLVRLDDRRILEGEGIEIVTREPLKDATYRALVLSDGSELIYGEIGVYAPGRGKIYGRSVKTLVEVDGKCYWGGEGADVAVYDERSRSISTMRMPEGVGEVTNMVALDKGRIASGTDRGVAVIDIRRRTASLISVGSPASPSDKVTNLFLDSRHRLWAFTESDGLTIIQPDLKQKKWLTAHAATPLEQTTCKYTVWLEDTHGTVWTIPRGGTFCYYDEPSATLVACPLYEQEQSEYTIPEIKRTFVDRQKNLWFTGLHSFNMLSFGKYNFQKVRAELFGNTRSIATMRNGDIWLGNETGRLMVFDSTDQLRGYIAPDGKLHKEPQIFAPAIYAIYQDSRGAIWIGTRGDGLYVISPDGSVENCRYNEDDPYSLSNNRANSIAEDTQGRIWVGTYGGGLNLAERRGGKLRFVNSRSRLGIKELGDNAAIRSISVTRKGVVILSTTRGVVCFSDRFSSPSKIRYSYLLRHEGDDEDTRFDVMQTLVTKSGRVFMATVNGEVSEMKASSLLSKPEATPVMSDAISEGPINGMLEDADGQIWIVRENNIDRYNPATGKANSFWPGKKSNYCDFTEATPRMNPASGRAVVCTQDGYMTFNPKSIKASHDAPRIMFTKVLVNGDKNETPILYSREVRLPSDKHSLTISFAALDYTAGRHIKYAYKLEGVDRQWNNIGYDHRVSFNDLPAGRYRLLVRSTNADGQWTDNTAEISIYATPAWWQTWWAYMAYLLIGAFVMLMIVKYYMMRRRVTIEKIVSQRKTMLYREASHKLRTPLTLIGAPIVEVLKSHSLTQEERQYLETARESSRNMLDLVDSMLTDNMEDSYFVDDENARVFADESEKADGQEEGQTGVRILIVEDNPDLRRFLVQLLSGTYSVMTAENGKQGLEMAVEQQPDFILSDVTMPQMDGLTMVRMIKQNPDICHIPIIILSARASLQDKVAGIEQGIDDYITKPFSAQYLKRRMREVIADRSTEQRRSLDEISQKQEGKSGEYQLSSVKIVDYDREMMQRLMAYLEENISNADLRVDDMVAAVNLGRTVFYNKLKSIVGMSPTDFVRDLRVRRAQEMMRSNHLTISEISIAVGFNDQRYFSRVFKKQTGMTPSEYREKMKNEE